MLSAGERSDGCLRCIPLAHIVECRADKQVVLERGSFLTVLDRAVAQAPRPPSTSCWAFCISAEKRRRPRRSYRTRPAEIADFLMLQAINRYEPLLAHHADSGVLHPEDRHRSACRPQGSSPRSRRRRSVRQARTYRHDRLGNRSEPVTPPSGRRSARCSRRRRFDSSEPKRFGICAGQSPIERSMRPVLCLLRAMPAEDLRRRFPNQLKIGPSGFETP